MSQTFVWAVCHTTPYSPTLSSVLVYFMACTGSVLYLFICDNVNRCIDLMCWDLIKDFVCGVRQRWLLSSPTISLVHSGAIRAYFTIIGFIGILFKKTVCSQVYCAKIMGHFWRGCLMFSVRWYCLKCMPRMG